MRTCWFLFLCCITQVCAYEKNKLTEEEYSELRSEVLNKYGTLPIDGVNRADEFLTEFSNRLTTRQKLKLLYAKAHLQIKGEFFDGAFSTLKECKILAEVINEPALTYYYHSYLAGMLATLENFELSLESYLDALQIAELTEDKYMIARVNNNIGHTLIQSGKFEQAAAYIEAFYQAGLNYNETSFIDVGLNNKGEIALGLGNIDQAVDFFQESLRTREENNRILSSSWSHHNLGLAFLAQNNAKKSEFHLKKAIEIREVYERPMLALRSKVALAQVYVELGDIRQSHVYIESVLREAIASNSISIASQAYRLLKEYYTLTKSYDLAVEAANGQLAKEKELIEKRSNSALMYYLAKTELHSKEKDNIELRKQNELNQQESRLKEQQFATLLLFSFVILIMILLFIWYLSRKNRLLKRALEQLELTQHELIEADKMSAMTTLVSGMAHQLNSPLGVVITANSVLSEQLTVVERQLQSKTLNLQTFEQYIAETRKTLILSEKSGKKIAELVQQFKMISTELEDSKITSFELQLFIREKMILLAQQYREISSIEVTGAEVNIVSYPDVLLKVIEEFIKNSAEHKVVDSAPLVSSISIKCKENSVEIIYNDNGAGIDEEIRQRIFDPFFTTKGMQKGLGLGLNIVYNSVIHLMQGKLTCPASAGATFVVELPLKIDSIS